MSVSTTPPTTPPVSPTTAVTKQVDMASNTPIGTVPVQAHRPEILITTPTVNPVSSWHFSYIVSGPTHAGGTVADANTFMVGTHSIATNAAVVNYLQFHPVARIANLTVTFAPRVLLRGGPTIVQIGTYPSSTTTPSTQDLVQAIPAKRTFVLTPMVATALPPSAMTSCAVSGFNMSDLIKSPTTITSIPHVFVAATYTLAHTTPANSVHFDYVVDFDIITG